MTKSVRLYGYLHGESSFAQVTRGLQRTLEAMGELAGLYPVDMDPELAPRELRGGESAPLSLNCGSPEGLLRAHRSGDHKEHWLLLAPNSQGLPHGFVEGLLKTSDILPRGTLSGGILAPSRWAASVCQDAFPEKKVLVAPHGVSPEVHSVNPKDLAASRRDFKNGLFDVLHMASTEADRKGTRQLMRAWAHLKSRRELPSVARLHIMMNPTHCSKVKWWAADLGLSENDYSVAPGLVHDRYQVANLYRAMHLVCQPSRAEGFGLVPLEALACGTPVAITISTGHSEYASTGLPGLMEVPHGPLGPMDDYPGSTAPTVTAEAIVHALWSAYDRWESLSAQAADNAAPLAEEWSWEKKNRPALTKMIAESP
jgi:glycosyltransferase involved in cell wall biosynthesis